MAGGDLLYIFAFIILPTAVLVSCIWALLLLRKGALLPERPLPPREYELAGERDEDEINLVEETGEHVVIVIEPAATPVATTPTPPPPAATPTRAPAPEPLASQVVADASVSDDLPLTERTQEMDAVPIVDPSATSSAPPGGPDEPLLVAEAPAAPRETPLVPAADDILLVPLEEPAHAPSRNGRTSATPPPDVPQAGGADSEPAVEPEPVAPVASGSRRPARRIAQPRPAGAEPARPRPRAGQRRADRGGNSE